MKLKFLMFSLFAMTFSACSSETEKEPKAEQKVEVHDVQYYLDNDAQREKQIAECKADPGTLRETPNCVNAAEANKKVRTQQMRDAINKG